MGELAGCGAPVAGASPAHSRVVHRHSAIPPASRLEEGAARLLPDAAAS